MAARIVPIVVFLGGGVVADRVGSRRVMIAADTIRCVAQAVFAAVPLTGHPPIWVFVMLVAAWGVGEAFFDPALGALIPTVVSDEWLQDANALVGMARSAAAVVGPALAGVLVAAAGAGVAVALDAGTYAVSVLAVALLRVPGRPVAAKRSMLADLREGWSTFRRHTWLWVTTLQFSLFNLLVWAPFLVLGPVVAHERLGGAQAWGLIMALYGVGAVLGGAVLIGKDPQRPLIVATIATFGFALPPAAIAAGLPVPAIGIGALLAGVGATVSGALDATTTQRQVPAAVLARISSITTLGAFVLGPLGLAAAGPVATIVGTTGLLAFGALWQLTTSAIVLATPAVRRVHRL
jgi:MFS family permease